jgi:hypothetical protein
VEENLVGTIGVLLHILGSPHEDLNMRSFSGVLLRRLVDSAAPFASKLDGPCMSEIRQKLMGIWTAESNHVILRRLAHVMAQSAAGGKWVDLIPTVVTHAQSQTGSSLIALMTLLEVIADYCPDDILTHVGILISFLGPYLTSTDLRLQIACARTVGACAVSLVDDSAREAFRSLLLPLLGVIGVALTNGQEVDATSIMECLTSIAVEQPMFFKLAMDQVVTAMLTVAGAASLEFSTRNIALELLVTLAESAPAMARRSPALVQGLVPLAMRMAAVLEDDESDWVRAPYTETCTDDVADAGEEAIERVAAGMGGKTLAPLVFAQVQSFASSADYQQRRAAIACLVRLAEGSPTVFKSFLKSALDFMLPALDDRSSRVQYAAMQAIGQLAIIYPDDMPTMVSMYAAKLISLLQAPTSCARVRGHAANALINLTNPKSCSREAIEPYLDSLLMALMQCLQLASLDVQPSCLTLLA